MGNCGIHIYSNLEDEIINFQGYFVTRVSSGIASRRCFASCGSVLLPLRAVAEKEGPLHSPSNTDCYGTLYLCHCMYPPLVEQGLPVSPQPSVHKSQTTLLEISGEAIL